MVTKQKRKERGKSPQRHPFPNTHVLGTGRALSLGSSERWCFFWSMSSYTTTRLLEFIRGAWLREEGKNWKPIPHVATSSTAHHPRVDSSVSSGICFVFHPEDLVVVSRRQAVNSFIPGQNQNSHFLFNDLNNE